MKTNEIREKYLDFFRTKGHKIVPSDVLVPKWDPTVLFTPAGMNQFKDHFLGKVELQFTRAATSQKCLRTGDIENVGRTAYHHTFFEMLGNFSFGDYFKREAIIWAWEFLTDKRWLAIDPNRLTVSVFLEDEEAAEIWHKDIGLPYERIARLGEHDNFWPAGAPTDGPDGVCGPCSEIFFHPDNGPECEIWNLVFTQFNRLGDPPNNLHPLPSRNIDTGMGLERIAATMQGVSTNFHIDILRPIVEGAADVAGLKYDPDSDDGRRLRRIADHVRACCMAIHENVYPGANKEEYVIRRLLRRAVLQGHEMGIRQPFLYRLVPVVVSQMEAPYPELRGTVDRVAAVIESEESNFFSTLDGGLARIESIFQAMQRSNASVVDGKEAFDLYQTYGIPAELFASIADERGLSFDWAGYQQATDQHAIDSGAGSKGVMGDFGPLDEIKREVKGTEFLGYLKTETQTTVKGIVEECLDLSGDQSGIVVQKRTKQIAPQQNDNLNQYLVLDSTPFYAEAGGQVGDTGLIVAANGTFQVVDTQKTGDVFVHLGKVIEGTIGEGEIVEAKVDVDRRDAIRRAHSATHLLHSALRQKLGDHAQQRGSKVIDDWFRFDFANQSAVEASHLAAIEQVVVEKIESGGPVVAEILPLEAAKQAGAMMLFGEKYPDPVRMVSIGEYSKELCGGTHVQRIEDVQAFEIVSEENISAGTRRIQAITGAKAAEHRQQVAQALVEIGKLLNAKGIDLPQRVDELLEESKSLRKQLNSPNRAGVKEEEKPAASIDIQSILSDNRGNELDYSQQREILRSIAHRMNVSLLESVGRVAVIKADIGQMRDRLNRLTEASVDVGKLLESAEEVGNFRFIVARIQDSDANQLKQLIDQIRKKNSPIALFFATCQGDDRVILVSGFSRELVEQGWDAGSWVKEIAPIVGGRGGGKPDLAQAGGKEVEQLDSALEAAKTYLLQLANQQKVS